MTISLMQGDCLEAMKDIPDNSVEAIITDLPYGTTACSWDTVIPFEPMWAQVKRILKPRGVFITTACQPFTSLLVTSNLKWFKEEIIWEKERPSNIFLMHNKHGKTHEDLIIFAGSGYTYNPQFYKRKYKSRVNTGSRSGIKHLSSNSIPKSKSSFDPYKQFPRSIIYFVRDVGIDNHPTQKPVALYRYLIMTYTNPGDTVLDCCMGSGTTGVACILEDRNFIGIELDEKYFAIAEKRIKEAAQQPNLFTGGEK